MFVNFKKLSINNTSEQDITKDLATKRYLKYEEDG